MEFARMKRAIDIAQAVATQFNWEPVISYSSDSNSVKQVILFNLNGCPEIKELLTEARSLASGMNTERKVNGNYTVLSICPDDGDFKISELIVTKDAAVKMFIEKSLGLDPGDVLCDSKWSKWTQKTDAEIIEYMKQQIGNLRDIFQIANKVAKKVRKEIDIQFESFAGWKAK